MNDNDEARPGSPAFNADHENALSPAADSPLMDEPAEDVGGEAACLPLESCDSPAEFAPEADWSSVFLPDPEPTIPRPSYELFSPGHAALAGFLGGFIAGGLVVAVNLWQLKRRGSAVLAFLFGCLVAGAQFAAPWVFTVASDIPHQLFFWILNTLLAYGYAWLLIGKDYATFRQQRGSTATGVAAAGLGCATSLVLLILFISSVVLLSKREYGQPVAFGKNQRVYCQPGVDLSLAKPLGKALMEVGLAEMNSPIDVQLGCDSTGQYWLAIIFDRP
ncbi:MAG: hypothetical protein JSS02_19420, partial [Planctomycetes bacterium]|nr:hypothetical protein [Planctomycetota bacterium]